MREQQVEHRPGIRGLRYEQLRGYSRDLVDDVETVAAHLAATGEWQGQLIGSITDPLRRAMVDMTPRGRYIECQVDRTVYPARWRFWFKRR